MSEYRSEILIISLVSILAVSVFITLFFAGCAEKNLLIYENSSAIENQTKANPIIWEKTTTTPDTPTNIFDNNTLSSGTIPISAAEENRFNSSEIYVKDLGSYTFASSPRSSANSELILIGEPYLGETVTFKVSGGWVSPENNYYSTTPVNATYYFNFSKSYYYGTYRLFEDPSCCIIISDSHTGEEIIIGNQTIIGEINVTINKTGFFKVAGTVFLSWKTETNRTHGALWTDLLFFNITENSYVVSRTPLYNETPDPCGPLSKVYTTNENGSVTDIREVRFCSTGPPINPHLKRNIMEKQEIPDELKQLLINNSKDFEKFRESAQYQILTNESRIPK